MNIDTQNSKILIVDDTPTNLEILSNTLIDAKYQVAVALNGESAIAQIKYKPPQLILLDVMMPGIDGFETCTRLKSDPETKEIPIIFMLNSFSLIIYNTSRYNQIIVTTIDDLNHRCKAWLCRTKS